MRCTPRDTTEASRDERLYTAVGATKEPGKSKDSRRSVPTKCNSQGVMITTPRRLTIALRKRAERAPDDECSFEDMLQD